MHLFQNRTFCIVTSDVEGLNHLSFFKFDKSKISKCGLIRRGVFFLGIFGDYFFQNAREHIGSNPFRLPDHHPPTPSGFIAALKTAHVFGPPQAFEGRDNVVTFQRFFAMEF